MTASIKIPVALSQLSSMSAAEWAQLASQRAPQLVTGLAVLGIAWQAAKLTWLFVTPATSVELPAPVQPLPAAVVSEINPQPIADAHLFGNVAAGPVIADPNNLPISQLNLVLAGTMAMADPDAGYAIVGENAANAKFYRVGSNINGSVRLHSVYSDRIVIDRSGTLELVKLPRGLASANVAPPPRASNLNTPGDNVRKIVSSNPNVLGDIFRAQPVLSNGVQKGYRVYPGRDRQQFVRLGLQSGDLVTSVNGTALDDVNRGTEILNSLTSSTTAQVTIERNGVSQSLVLDMSTLNLPENASAQSSSDKSSSSSSGPRTGGLTGSPVANTTKSN